MAALTWDEVGARLYETGVSNGVLFPWDTTLNSGAGGYAPGIAWNGLISVTESPSGAEATPLYADNIKYLTMMSVEELGATVEAYAYPPQFALCDGSANLFDTAVTPAAIAGISAGQQARQMFGLAYVTKVGNDSLGDAYGKKIHLLYGCKASPSERAYQTINDSPEAITFSWELTTNPVSGTGILPTASIVIDQMGLDSADRSAVWDALWALIFGTTGVSPIGDPTLPLPDALVAAYALATA
jgi:hypothetical protein